MTPAEGPVTTTARVRRLALLLTVIVLVLSLAGGGGIVAAEDLPRAEPGEVGMSSERLGRIGAALQRSVDRQELPGAVTLVARHGKVVYLESVGYRDVESGTPMRNDTIFRIRSMTKPVTSLAVMMLFEEGRFLLTDPISRFLPEFSEMQVTLPLPEGVRADRPYTLEPARRRITIQHLLTHTAGLANRYRGLTRAEYSRVTRRGPGETMDEVVKRLAKMPLNFQPGDNWEYGPATNVLGRLIEVVSGQTLDQFFREKIFEPLGMHDTYFYLPTSKLDRFASQYSAGPDGKIRRTEAANAESPYVKEPHVYFAGAGGLVSTATDYWRFCQLMLNGGELDGVRLVGRKTVELMTTNHTGDYLVWVRGPGHGFGLGYAVVTDVGKTALPWSLGSYLWEGASGTAFWIDPQEGLIAILLTQRQPYSRLKREIVSLVNQAIIDSPLTARPAF